jgi:hypothetical protein
MKGSEVKESGVRSQKLRRQNQGSLWMNHNLSLRTNPYGKG